VNEKEVLIMKIIQVDNFNRDTVSDVLIVEKVSENHAQMIVEALNAKYSGDLSPMFFRVEADDYELYKWSP